MGAAMDGMAALIRILSALLFYGMIAVILLMLYKITKEVADIKRAIADLQESVMMAMLPKEKPERAEKP